MRTISFWEGHSLVSCHECNTNEGPMIYIDADDGNFPGLHLCRSCVHAALDQLDNPWLRDEPVKTIYG